MLVVGCNGKPSPPTPPPPKPTIRVERQENVNGVKLIIWYDNHKRDYLGSHQHSEPYASFHVGDEADLREYKKQIEFALSQIEEVEQRMSVHEPEAKQDEGPN